MQITQAYIQEIIEKYQKGLTHVRTERLLDQDQRHKELLSVLAFSMHYNPDVIFDLLLRGVDALRSSLDSFQDNIDALQEALPDITRRNQPIDDVTDLNLAVSALSDIEATLMEKGRIPRGKIAALDRGVDRYTQRLKPSITDGVDYRRPSVEARKLLEDQLDNLDVAWDRVIGLVFFLIDAVDSYLNSATDKFATLAVVQNVKSEYERIQSRSENSSPESRADEGIDDFVHLLAGQDVLSEIFQSVDPTLAKVTGDTIQAVGTSTSAELLSDKSAPYHLTSTTNGLDLTVDEVNAQSFSLPLSSPARILGGVAPFTFDPIAGASRAATIVGPYTTPVRATAVDMASTLGSKVYTSATATFTTTLQVGDYISLTGALTLSGYVQIILDNNTIVLDTAATATAAGITYNAYRDNRFRITIRNSVFAIPLTVGAAVLATTWQTELSTALGATAVVSIAGGLITITDALTGKDSTMHLTAGEAQGLMGMGTGSTNGTGSDLTLTGLTDQGGPETLTIVAGTYATAALMAAHLNTLATATTWVFEAFGNSIRVRTAGQGQSSFVEITDGNDVLGFIPAREDGDVLHIEDLVEYVLTNSIIPLELTYTNDLIFSGENLAATNGSGTVQDTSADFVNGGIKVGDTLHIPTGSNQGYYHITSVAATVLGLDATQWVPANVTTESNLQYKIERQLLLFASQSTSLTSAVLVGTGTANASLGLTNNTEVRGKVQNLEIIQGAVVADPEELRLTNNDRILSVTPSQSLSISDLDDTTVSIVEEVDNNFTSTDFDITSKSALQFNALKSALETWRDTQLPLVKDGQDSLDTIIMFLNRASKTATPLYVGEALQEVATLEAVLFGTGTGLLDQLEAYQPTRLVDTDTLLRMLRDEKADRLSDLLTQGRFADIFSSVPATASHVGFMGMLMSGAIKVLGEAAPAVNQFGMTPEELEDG